MCWGLSTALQATKGDIQLANKAATFVLKGTRVRSTHLFLLGATLDVIWHKSCPQSRIILIFSHFL